jgi:MoaA/NifB/PqqE/SkfB family radical SAM enzyme
MDFANPCSHKCQWCSWQKHRKDEGGFLSEEAFKSIAIDCMDMGVRGFEVCGGGEPLIHPNAHLFIKTLGELGNLLLITNGSHLTKEDAHYSKTIRVSLDAATAETHKKLHESDDWNQVLENIRSSAETTRVGLGFLIHPDNFEEIPLFAKLGKKLGCEFVHIRPCYTDYDEVRDLVGFDWFEWVKTKHSRLDWLIAEAKKAETDDFKVYATFYKTQPLKDWVFKRCYAPYLNPQITPSGAVWICCEQRGEPGAHIGTIGVDGSLKDIWFSEKHRHLMNARPNDWCFAKCKFRGYNKAIWEAYVEPKYDLEWT